MTDIVLIPTFKRPEYLWLCLEHIRKAQGTRELDIRVFHDMRTGTPFPIDTVRVCEQFGVRLTVRPPSISVGNCYNFLEAYKEAYETDARYVYLIEDDVLVEPDFFDWHEAVQARKNYFCSVAWHCIPCRAVEDAIRLGEDWTKDPRAIVETSLDFSSIGVCWKRENLEWIGKHASQYYYRSPVNHLAAHFPNSPLPPNNWTEQAGLIKRQLLNGKGSRVVAWAGRPRCAHVGIRGYHRKQGHNFIGTLSERIENLRTAITSGTLPKMSADTFDDINLPHQTVVPWAPEELYVARRY